MEVQLLPYAVLRGWGAEYRKESMGSLTSDKKGYNPENDPEAEHIPNDGITCMKFSPKAMAPNNFLAVTTWEGELRCYEVDGSTGKTKPVGMQKHEKPAMCCAWKLDGGGVLSGGADGKGMLWDIRAGTWTQIAMHDAPISGIFHSELPSPCYITGSWDRTLKFWDARNPSASPIGVLQVPDRVYAMDVVDHVMIVATAERHVLVYDLRNPAQPFRQKFSPLKYQTRCVAIFPDKTGFCVGSIEGRVGVEHISDADLPKNFAFKCHRQNTNAKDPELYAVNTIAFHPLGTFATAGGDGSFNFWDKDAKHRLKAFQRADQPITSSHFNHDGSLFAYSVCYDWSKGVDEFLKLNAEQRKGRIMIHLVKQECQPKKDVNTKRW
ncbi:putative Rae1, nuclear pore complex component [Guillardia theta CCMP2712]|uniref:Putative Rae1, nuclear pore complex component n=1 Tax=Guillardia theta (strain CCMP2712) TaxID=905079 RepID=L1JT35_GUITC|nr:putative Rae1, nuclear pore complex component [Guillardia theta CCMP2712]EKX51243.1 putative Rae1, nuclear pore complex component [Guillardia theta CCMP2712]|eukprot:XP_005838223.1 putative Rae1, nuclear pore complex component [Guillardia theta CCMP2712]